MLRQIKFLFSFFFIHFGFPFRCISNQKISKFCNNVKNIEEKQKMKILIHQIFKLTCAINIHWKYHLFWGKRESSMKFSMSLSLSCPYKKWHFMDEFENQNKKYLKSKFWVFFDSIQIEFLSNFINVFFPGQTIDFDKYRLFRWTVIVYVWVSEGRINC